MQGFRIPPSSAQRDFFDPFCTFCQSSVCPRSWVFAVASSTSVSAAATRRVIRALPKPPMPAPITCGNSFSAFKEELLYDFRLNLVFDNPTPRPMYRLCISAIAIKSPKAANLPRTHTCQSFEPEPVPESKPDNITSRAAKHKRVVFTKSPRGKNP